MTILKNKPRLRELPRTGDYDRWLLNGTKVLIVKYRTNWNDYWRDLCYQVCLYYGVSGEKGWEI